jgi:hypothetical protein
MPVEASDGSLPIYTRNRRKEKPDFSMPVPILFYNNAEVKVTFPKEMMWSPHGTCKARKDSAIQ